MGAPKTKTPFRTLAAILDFTGSAVLQAVRECPFAAWLEISLVESLLRATDYYYYLQEPTSRPPCQLIV